MRVWSYGYLMAVCAVFLLSASFAFSHPVGGDQKQNLMGTVGKNITLPLWTNDLQGDYQIVWCVRNGDTKDTLFVCDKGEIDRKPPNELEGKLILDTKTGSLTIGPLSVSDSHVYEAEITDENSTVHRYIFTLTVSDPVSDPMTAGPSRNTTTDPPKDQGNHTAAIIAGSVAGVVVLLVVVVVVVYLIRTKKKEGRGHPDLY